MTTHEEEQPTTSISFGELTSHMVSATRQLSSAKSEYEIAQNRLITHLEQHQGEQLALTGLATFIGFNHGNNRWGFSPYNKPALLPPNLYIVGKTYKDGEWVVDLSNVGQEDHVKFRTIIRSIVSATEEEVAETARKELWLREQAI